MYNFWNYYSTCIRAREFRVYAKPVGFSGLTTRHYWTTKMGRESEYYIQELKHLARACIYASKDPVTGTDRTTARIRTNSFEKFRTLSPRSTNEVTYGERAAKSVRGKFGELSADIQKFKDPQPCVLSSKPFGASEVNIMSIAIAIH